MVLKNNSPLLPQNLSIRPPIKAGRYGKYIFGVVSNFFFRAASIDGNMLFYFEFPLAAGKYMN